MTSTKNMVTVILLVRAAYKSQSSASCLGPNYRADRKTIYNLQFALKGNCEAKLLEHHLQPADTAHLYP